MGKSKDDGSEESYDSTAGQIRGQHTDSERIRVSESVYEGLEAVRKSGLTNMLDRPAVARIADEFGFYETANWVTENRKLYAEGIFRGFEVKKDENAR